MLLTKEDEKEEDGGIKLTLAVLSTCGSLIATHSPGGGVGGGWREAY